MKAKGKHILIDDVTRLYYADGDDGPALVIERMEGDSWQRLCHTEMMWRAVAILREQAAHQAWIAGWEMQRAGWTVATMGDASQPMVAGWRAARAAPRETSPDRISPYGQQPERLG